MNETSFLAKLMFTSQNQCCDYKTGCPYAQRHRGLGGLVISALDLQAESELEPCSDRDNFQTI